MTNPLAELQTTIDQAVRAAGDRFVAQLAAKDQELAAAKARIADLEAQLHPTPAGTTLWGANASSPAALAAVEKTFGPVQLVRYYHQPGEGVGWPSDMPLGNRVLVYSSKVNPKDIAAGKADDSYRALFAAAPPDRPTYVCVWHEPEDDVEAGRFTVDDLRAAWRRVTPLARAAGPHIRLLPILMNATYRGLKGRRWQDFVPDAFDALGVDGYAGGGIGVGVPDIPRMFDAAVAAAGGKPWLVCETGIGAKVGPGRGDALMTLARTIRSKGAVGACYFNNAEWQLGSDEAGAWNKGRAA